MRGLGGVSHRLSGQAAILWNMKFDKDGKRFASGVPVLGAEGAMGQGLRSAQGQHLSGRFGCYTGSARRRPTSGARTRRCTRAPTPIGRYQNGKRTLGMGLPADGIDWQVVAAWANVCEANAWSIFGVLYEPGDRWANLKDICFAGGAEPVAGGKLTFRYSAPVVALDTVTAERPDRRNPLGDRDAVVPRPDQHRDPEIPQPGA